VLLQIEDLLVRYGYATALSDLNITVEKGTCSVMVGPNGAGKSTLLRTISGLVKPIEGRIVFQGREIQNLSPDTIVKMGLIHCPERRRLFSGMSVMDNLKLGAYLVKNSADVQRGLENVFGWFPILKERSKQISGTLSGGQQQMLAIGRSLMSQPELLMLDEPSLGLSPKVKETIFQGIREIKKSGVTIILVEQDVYTSSQIADVMYVLTAGKIISQGTPEELLSDAQFVKEYLGTTRLSRFFKIIRGKDT